MKPKLHSQIQFLAYLIWEKSGKRHDAKVCWEMAQKVFRTQVDQRLIPRGWHLEYFPVLSPAYEPHDQSKHGGGIVVRALYTDAEMMTYTGHL